MGNLPKWVTADLNEWFRFDKPGKYRLFLTGHPSRNRFGFTEREDSRPPSVSSNIVEFQVLPADPSWSAQELRKAIGVLESKVDFQEQLEGFRIARFLGTEGAASEMIKRYVDQGLCQFQYRAGLFSSAHREFVVRKMEEGLAAPDQPVSKDYLRTLSTLSVYLLHPELLPPKSNQYRGQMMMGGPLAGRYDLVEAEQATYVPSRTGYTALHRVSPQTLCALA